MSDIVSDIEQTIDWLQRNVRNSNLSAVSMRVQELSIQCYTFSKLVADAYDQASVAEDLYKKKKASFIDNYTGPVTKAPLVADADKDMDALKKDCTEKQNMSHRYKLYLKQFEQIIDCFRQRVSVEKQTSYKLNET